MRGPRLSLALGLALATALAVGCGEGSGPVAGGDDASREVREPRPILVDVTESAGIDFVHDNGHTPRRYLPETMGAGVALLDADGDGLLDLFLVDSGPVENGGASRPGVLYRNLGGMRFEEVAESGLDGRILGQGVAVGDVDADGDPDLLVTGVGADRLYLNRGDGSFARAGEETGLPEPGFSSSAAFLDFDRDGRLDLFLGRYVTWSRADDVACRPDGEHRTYCTPEVYSGASNRLLRNVGGARFEDVTEAAGLSRPAGKTLGVVPLDADGDGWTDLAVANDTAGNFLFLNRGDGTFREAGVELGIAFGPSGAPRGSMGIDAGDVDGDGRPDLLVANFAQEMSALFVSSSRGVWTDDAAAMGIGLPSLMTLAFGALLSDLDLDGALDAVLVNGHIEPEIHRYQATQSYAQPMSVYRGVPEGFQEVPVEELPIGKLVGRGLAVGDLDGDGDLDLVVTQNGGPPKVLENRARAGAWVRFAPRARTSNPSGYGLEVAARVGPDLRHRSLVSGRSYLSASEPVLTLGSGIDRPESLEVRWPSGRRQRLESPPAERTLVVWEPGSS